MPDTSPGTAEHEPEHDDQFPRIAAYQPGADDPEWPEGWAAEPTEATPLLLPVAGLVDDSEPAPPAEGVPAQPEEESP